MNIENEANRIESNKLAIYILYIYKYLFKQRQYSYIYRVSISKQISDRVKGMQAQPATKESTAVAATALPAAAAAAAGGGSNDSVALWLYNKLHSPTHLWSFSSTVVSQYNLEKLHAIRDCFGSLDSIVKIKFFLTLFHVPKRNYEEVYRLSPLIPFYLLTLFMFCVSFFFPER